MLRSIATLRCNPTCEMRSVCHACPSTSPRTHARGAELKKFCRETRWALIGGVAGMSIVPVAARLIERLIG
jgi:hypothetical protein